MIPGDIPCNEPCVNTLCHYCAFSTCLDNCTCDEQMLVHYEDNENENTQEDNQ